ncbi:hypothetical protein ACFLR2_02605 [Chlamydiota bacterium]
MSSVKRAAGTELVPVLGAKRFAGEGEQDDVGNVAREALGRSLPLLSFGEEQPKVVLLEESSSDPFPFDRIPMGVLDIIFGLLGFKGVFACRSVNLWFNGRTQPYLAKSLLKEMDDLVAHSICSNSWLPWQQLAALASLARAYEHFGVKRKAAVTFDRAKAIVNQDDIKRAIGKLVGIARLQAESNLFEEAEETVNAAFEKMQSLEDNNVMFEFFIETAQFYSKFRGKADLSETKKILDILFGKISELKKTALCSCNELPILLKIETFNALLKFKEVRSKLSEMENEASIVLISIAKAQFAYHRIEECEKTLVDFQELRKAAAAAVDGYEAPDDASKDMYFLMMQIHVAQGDYEKAREASAQYFNYEHFDSEVFWALAKQQETPEKAAVFFNIGKDVIFYWDDSDIPSGVKDLIIAQIDYGMVEEARETAKALHAFLEGNEIDEETLNEDSIFYFKGCPATVFVDLFIKDCQKPACTLVDAKEKADGIKDGLEKLNALLAIVTSLNPIVRKV